MRVPHCTPPLLPLLLCAPPLLLLWPPHGDPHGLPPLPLLIPEPPLLLLFWSLPLLPLLWPPDSGAPPSPTPLSAICPSHAQITIPLTNKPKSSRRRIWQPPMLRNDQRPTD